MDFKDTALTRDQIIEVYDIIRKDLQKGREKLMKIFFPKRVNTEKMRNEFFIDL